MGHVLEELLVQCSGKLAKDREKAARALGSIGATDDSDAYRALPYLAKLLEDKSAKVKEAACAALSELPSWLEGDEVIAAGIELVRLAGEQDVAIARTAILAIGNLRINEAVPKLLELIGPSDVGLAAIDALPRFPDRAADIVKALLSSLKIEGCRLQALDALRELQLTDESEVRELLPYCESGGDLGRIRAYGILANSSTARPGIFGPAVDTLQRGLRDRHFRIRAHSARAAGNLRMNEAEDDLIELLKDRDTRFEAVEALGKIRSARSVRSLSALLSKADDKDAVALIFCALSQIASKEALDALIEAIASGGALRDPAIESFLAADIALLSEASASLACLLAHQYLPIVQKTIAALAIKKSSSVSALEERLRDPDPVLASRSATVHLLLGKSKEAALARIKEDCEGDEALIQLALLGDAKAASMLADKADVDGSGRDPNLSFFLTIAAGAGDPIAQEKLAFLFHSGIGVERNQEKAAELYLLAAKQGNKEACSSLSNYYSFGLGGLKRDEQLARYYDELAGEARQPSIQEILARGKDDGIADVPDLSAEEIMDFLKKDPETATNGPVSEDEISEAEAFFGIEFPPLLRRLYLEIGPGDYFFGRIYGLEGKPENSELASALSSAKTEMQVPGVEQGIVFPFGESPINFHFLFSVGEANPPIFHWDAEAAGQPEPEMVAKDLKGFLEGAIREKRVQSKDHR